MSEQKKGTLLGHFIGGFILVGIIFLIVAIFTQIHREGIVGYIFQWIIAIYLFIFSIGLLIDLFKKWRKKRWYTKLIQLFGVILMGLLSVGYTLNAYQDWPYLNQPSYVELINPDVSVDFTRERNDYILSGKSSSGAEFEFNLTKSHYNQALDLEEKDEFNSAEVSYLPHSRIIMELTYNQ
ncbi:DUF308 domain-containing protein [Aerococcaceae bacterium DSM 111021]|nr:DUF308 domain-containing protein [Aerococcaceae bacterium DSM 111021]